MHQVRQHYRFLFPIMLSILLGVEWGSAQSPKAPTTAPKVPTTAPKVPTIVSYAMRHKTPAEIETAFSPLVESAPNVHMQSDNENGRLVLEGPPWAHQLLAQVLQRLDQAPTVDTVPANVANSDAATSNSPSSSTVRLLPPKAQPGSPVRLPDTQQIEKSPVPANVESVRRILPLPTGQSKAIRDHVLRLFGERLQVSNGQTAQGSNGIIPGQFSMTTSSGILRIGFDLDREDVLLDGPANVVDQFGRLLTAIVQRFQRQSTALTNQPQQRVLMLRREVQPGVKQLIDSSQNNRSPSQVPDTDGAALGDQRSRMLFRLTGIQQASTQAAQDLPPPTSNPQSDTNRSEPAAPRPIPPSLPQLEGVEVETLPDLDAIILRGRDQDLDQLSEIIRELELLSRQTQPAIEVIYLQHTHSQGISDLIEQTQESLLGTRQGRAIVTPLGKPNALLLLGWGDAVAALKELIAKLDQPVPPESQFNLFRLKYASAAALQRTINSFFARRQGDLAPQVMSTIDIRTNSLIVHAAPRDMIEVARLVERLDTIDGETVQRTRVFEIQNSLAADVAETLRNTIDGTNSAATSTAMELMLDDRGQSIISGILENIQITVDARKNNLIISAPAENFDVIEALIEKLDSPGMVAKIKIFPIQNGDAASLIQTLRSLLPSRAGADPVTSAQLSSSPGESSLAPLRFTVDIRSNSIIATGSDGDLRIVDALLLRLDEADAMQRQNTVYQLKNSPAVDVALAINEFLRNTRQVENASPAVLNPYAQLEKEVVVVPEPVSNKLIVSATPRYFNEVRMMIEKLDEQPPQVMIQVLIAEVLLNNTDEFGVELGIQDSVLFDRSLLGDLLTVTSTTNVTSPGGAVTSTTQDNVISATNEPGLNFNSTDPLGNSGSAQAIANAANIGGQGISNFDLGRANAELGFGGLVLSASSENVSVLLRALEESRRLEVLSRPQVLTLDNQPAFIQVGQRVPRITGSTINQIGQQNTITLENVGLILGVTPRISPEGNVTMEIDAEKSEVGPESEGIPVSATADGTVVRSPRVNVASAQATVSAADGETIILGGLISNNRKQHHRKVPWLGDLPLIKHLFRYDSVSNRRAELLIILTPHIVRSPADMERLKQTEMARMSWCACDVFNLHGEIVSDPTTESLFSGNYQDFGVDVIYPHDDPRGQNMVMEPSEIPNEMSVLQPAHSSMQNPVINGSGNIMDNTMETTVENLADPIWSASPMPDNTLPPGRLSSPDTMLSAPNAIGSGL
ncbi:putative type II secretion system protein D precursor [Planctomycetes bacterium CA13]|uniref:Putative type II secretion system protein D n=1 Tax=Novipirellula herctigrandis TaxID=2527986 RepID=A0A5C5Z496_9BACT|nr:putative type II secretion system protein D precursor [Planctomycetes bacterium CA13]